MVARVADSFLSLQSYCNPGASPERSVLTKREKTMKTINCEVIRFEDGTVNEDATVEAFQGMLSELVATETADFETVAVEIEALKKANPGLRTIASDSLTRRLWERRLESGALKDVSDTDRDAQYKRLAAVVPEYVKSNTDAFHMGRKSGIAFLDRLTDEERAKIAEARAEESKGNGKKAA